MRLKFKRNYPLLIALVLVLGSFEVGLGNQRIIAYTVRGSQEIPESQTANYANSVALFDQGVVHTIQIQMDEEDYQTMLTTYQQTGEKDYFPANVIIDGVQVNEVGIRLKGNASLRQAVGGGMNRGGGQAMGGGGGMNRAGGQPAGGGQPPTGGDENSTNGQPFGGGGMNPGGGQPPTDGDENSANGQPFGGGGMNPGGGQPPTDRDAYPTTGQGFNRPDQQMRAPDGQDFQPQQDWQASGQAAPTGNSPFANRDTTQVPLMIKFDEFVAGQSYQGYDRLAIRSAGATYDASMLQEPLTNSVFLQAGLPAVETAYAGVSLNGQAEQLFTISEAIKKDYVEKWFTNADGILYKAELQANMNYQGEDPSAYAGDFTQETRVNEADMAPLIQFLKFVSESDDATFESQLPDYLDVDSFAGYLAVNSLLVNSDSMAGMGNNFYLYYDDLTGRFSVLMWDANESLGKLSGGRGGATNSAVNADIYPQTGGRGGRGMGMGNGSNPLLTRFMANPTFKALYEAKVQSIYQQAFLSGAILQQIDQFTAVVREANATRNFVDADAYEQAVANVVTFVNQRSEYLASLPLLSGQTASQASAATSVH